MRRGFVDQFNYLSSPLQSMGFNPTHFTTVPVKAALLTKAQRHSRTKYLLTCGLTLRGTSGAQRQKVKEGGKRREGVTRKYSYQLKTSQLFTRVAQNLICVLEEILSAL